MDTVIVAIRVIAIAVLIACAIADIWVMKRNFKYGFTALIAVLFAIVVNVIALFKWGY